MTTTSDHRPPAYAAVVLLLLFVASGCAALIYELVWFQQLELFVGSSAVSVGVLLAAFMGGMSLGSALFSRVIPRGTHPLRVYASLELGIAIAGVVLLLGAPAAGALYAGWAPQGVPGFAFRGMVAALCLLPPTMLMGATLPAAARWLGASRVADVSWVGWFYAGNIAGAVVGSLAGGFYLLRIHDMTTATWAAVSLNVLVAIAALILSHVAPRGDRATERQLGPIPPEHGSAGTVPAVAAGPRLVYLVIAISGFCALAGQVVWTRILGLLFGGTVYTFSLILAVFLIGLGLGSAAGAALVRVITSPARALGWCQLLLVGAIAWTAYMLTSALPYWPIITSASPSVRYTFEIQFACAFLAIVPAPILWGASFPFALAAASARAGSDPAQPVGRVYAANTIGAIAGSLATSLFLIAEIGSQHVQQVMMIASAYAGTLLLMELGGVLLAGLTAALWLVVTVPRIPDVLIAYGKYAVTWAGHTGEMLFVAEGVNASIAVSRLPNGALNYHNAGKIQASSQPQDMRLQRMLGHLTTLVTDDPRHVLVIGCGSGVTAGAVSIDPRVRRQTIVEIESLVPEVASRYFGAHNFHVLDNGKVDIVIDDARHYLMTAPATYDAITADPFDPWVRGAATLYTHEFFTLLKQRLNPGGIVTMWVPLYTTTDEAVKSQVATFFSVFPGAFVMANTREGRGYDVVLVGQRDPRPIDVDAVEARLRDSEYAQVLGSMSEVGLGSAVDLFGTYAGRGRDMREWLADGQINRDGNLRLQYLAGLGLDVDQPDAVYAGMTRYWRYPEELFTASPALLQRLQQAMEASARRTPPTRPRVSSSPPGP